MAMGSMSTRSGSPGAAVSSTPCSSPGSRRRKNWRSPRQTGVPTNPAAISCSIRLASGARAGRPAAWLSHSSSWAASQSLVGWLAGSSSQRYGSATW